MVNDKGDHMTAYESNKEEEFEVTINPDDPLFIISVVASMVDIPVWTLRKLDEFGVVCPERIGKKARCYSKNQIKTLKYVQYLMEDKGVNISGIKIILEMEGDQNGEHD
jgi:MerR family transcriptional regulator/heat shock protein HspR